jgi:EAL domain-containing protein (putative c-di-GMP-specific phosphodiesterase class I)
MPAVARLGGAEFLLVDLRPASEPEALLHLLAQLEDEPFESGGQSVAIGMRQVWVKGNALELGTLIDHARTRLRTLGPEDSKLAALSLASRRELVASFRQALASQLIQPWFQPIVDCHTNAITGWEALARWEHPEHGLITPESFLAIARVSRQLTLLTQTMLQATTRFIQELHRHGLHDSARVHLNITASELGNPATLDWIERCLATSGVAARDIVIELSEKDALVIDERLARNLQRMQQIGMLLAIDDFGTGYANLGQLLDLPAYAIKIDKRFVEKLPQDKDSAALIRAMITLAAGLGMQAIAEGVEQEVQLDFLREHGCDACQGFRSAPALPAPAALALAKDWPAQPATA